MKSLIYRIFTSLKGRWLLKRNIPNFGVFEGYASFAKPSTKSPDNKHVLFYREEGTLKLTSGTEVTATKEYVYRYQEQEDQISTFFLEDGSYDRLFHILKFESDIQETYPIKAEGYHRCKNDDYDAKYHFLSSDEFSLAYKVDGPNKDYSSVAFFKKVTEVESQNTQDALPNSFVTNNKS